MTSPQAAAKRRGAQWETDLLTWFRERGYPAERLHLAGTKYEGDLAVSDVGITYVVEAKNVAKVNMTDFVRQADEEATNYAAARGLKRGQVMPLAIIKRRGKSTGDAYVLTTLDEFFDLLPG